MPLQDTDPTPSFGGFGFRRLLWAEGDRVGIGRHLINVPDCINVGDGGIDAYIDGAHPSDDDVIPEGSSVFQIKSADLGPTACKRELHVKGDLAKPLKDALDRRLHDGATYVLVLMAEITDAKLMSRHSAVKQELAKYGYHKTQVRVYTANKLAGFTNRHPSLVASLRPGLSTCESYETWSSSRDVRHPAGFVADSRRQDMVDQITSGLRLRDTLLPSRFNRDQLPNKAFKGQQYTDRFFQDCRGRVFPPDPYHAQSRIDSGEAAGKGLPLAMRQRYRFGVTVRDGNLHYDVQFEMPRKLQEEQMYCAVEGDVWVTGSHANVGVNDFVWVPDGNKERRQQK